MRHIIKKTCKYLLYTALAIVVSLYIPANGQAYSASTQLLLPYEELSTEGCVYVGVRGDYINESQAVIDRINAIRWEACQEGVPNPDNPSVGLTMADYVPISWASGLERIARLRAAEATLLNEHTRPNGKSCFSISSAGDYLGSGETLAWNNSAHMTYGIEQWYDEKKDWVERNSFAVTGHYTAMIDPSNTYVGVASIVSEYGQYGNATCARFGRTLADSFKDFYDDLYDDPFHNPQADPFYSPQDDPYSNQNGDAYAAVDSTMAAGIKDCIQPIEIQASMLGAPFLGCTSSRSVKYLKEGDVINCELLMDTSALGDSGCALVLGNIRWESSDNQIATVDSYGKVKGVKAGTVTITAYSDNGYSASSKFTFSPKVSKSKEKSQNNVKNPTKAAAMKSFKVKAGKKKLTVTWKKISGIFGYQLQVSTKRNFTNARKINIKNTKTKYVVKKLKQGKKYYLRMRTYEKTNGKRIYGKWARCVKLLRREDK